MGEQRDSGVSGRKLLFLPLALSLAGAVYRCSQRHNSFDDVVNQVQAEEPKRDKEFPQRFVAKSAVPKPFNGLEDAVGGIESITIAGKRYWFGVCYSMDAVLSPLIDDPRVMAQFGSDYMLQTDGAHPPKYWERLVKTAVDTSDLDSEPGGRDFTGVETQTVLQEIDDARRDHRPAKLELSDNLTYLFDATLVGAPRSPPEPCSGEQGEAIKRVDQYENCWEGALRVISSAAEPPKGADYEDALQIVEDYIDQWQRDVPENWRSLLLHKPPADAAPAAAAPSR